MEVSAIWKQAGGLIVKYKYALLILLLGVVLILWPGERDSPAPASQSQADPTATALEQLEKELAELLSQVDGAGEVQVMLRLKSGTQYIYQTDQTQEELSGERRTSSQTVLVEEQGLVAQTLYPTFQGALVVSSGADRAQVKLDLTNAVASLTGLTADHITVVKMNIAQ